MPLFGDEDDGPAGDRPMTLAEHLDELRKRLFWCVLIVLAFFCVALYAEPVLLGIALWPAYSVLRGMKGGEFIATEVSEKFMTSMKLDLVVALFLAAPMILYILWGFVARGLHSHEKRYVRIYAPFSYVLFMGGCVFFYFVIQPVTLQFLLDYRADDILAPDGTIIAAPPKLAIQSTISFFLSMTLVMGLFFELPLVMLFVQAIRIATWKTYLKYAKHFVFALFVAGAIITPTPDAATLLVFMTPVLALFFGGILLCRMMAPSDI